MLEGLDYIDEGKVFKNKKSTSKSILMIVKTYIMGFFDRFIPFRDTLAIIRGRHIRAVASFFNLIRQMMSEGVFYALVFTPFYYFNQVDHWTDTNSNFTTCTGPLSIPILCSMNYSRVKSSNGIFYAVSLLIFAAMRLRNTLLNYIEVNTRSFEESFDVDQEDFIYSSTLLNAWNYTITNKVDKQSNLDACRNMMLT